MPNPKVFVASSSEAYEVAEALQQNLEARGEVQVTLWGQAFQVGTQYVDDLLRNLENADFGVFVFHPDDQTRMRNKAQATTRDNVILELGMCIGRLGKKRSFMLAPKGGKVRIPTDLVGITAAEYDLKRFQEAQDKRAALGAASSSIAASIRRQRYRPSPELDRLIGKSLEAVCRAMSIPMTPQDASLRAFIFAKEENRLVCRYFWDPNPSTEEIGTTRFDIDKQTAEKVIVVKCYLQNQLLTTASARKKSRIQGDSVKPLPRDFHGASGKIRSDIRYVLATPIRNAQGEIWGIVDFDALKPSGRELLESEWSKSVILALSHQLSCALNLK